MQSAMILTHGLPGSGKSSIAAMLRDVLPGRVEVAERDEIRAAILPTDYHNRGHDDDSELLVSARQHELLKSALSRGSFVVVSDTNLTEDRLEELVEIALSYGASIFHIHLDIPAEEAKRRNRERAAAGGRLVPEWVINYMATYGYSNDRIKVFSVINEDEGFKISIADRVGSELNTEEEIRLVLTAARKAAEQKAKLEKR